MMPQHHVVYSNLPTHSVAFYPVTVKTCARCWEFSGSCYHKHYNSLTSPQSLRSALVSGTNSAPQERIPGRKPPMINQLCVSPSRTASGVFCGQRRSTGYYYGQKHCFWSEIRLTCYRKVRGLCRLSHIRPNKEALAAMNAPLQMRWKGD
ncbi:hypothetical protein OE88DRAFT_1655395 [Heliocybe sulcata]|uniref:Uncharacterized protein n=1 Tax=Heliocybe sulcata TaxID=5364 RepID=A0A5C3N7R3_9AGAM|nr:hypothetical protein OE88DRAFT_1655395 [Heliocybe sulcata]